LIVVDDSPGLLAILPLSFNFPSIVPERYFRPNLKVIFLLNPFLGLDTVDFTLLQTVPQRRVVFNIVVATTFRQWVCELVVNCVHVVEL